MGSNDRQVGQSAKNGLHSPFLTDSLTRISLPPQGLALDLPCGGGRHIPLLVGAGLTVVAADIDPDMLRRASRMHPSMPIRLDARQPLPFLECTFDLALVIHPMDLDVLSALPALIRPGGYLVLETFGAQGLNAVALPRQGEVSERLATTFNPVRYLERPTRRMPDRFTVKALFQRNSVSA